MISRPSTTRVLQSPALLRWFTPLLCGLLLHPLQAQDSDVRISTVANNGMPRNIVSKGADWNFGPGSLWTHKGWQYAAFWDRERQVSVARRKLPSGKWSVVSLPGYQRSGTGDRGKGGAISRGFGDGHEKIALGISPDGFIHLSFDHHMSTLRYRTSRLPVAEDPENHPWTTELFGPVRDNLGGAKITSVTYPSFHTDGAHFLLYLRLGGGSGSADSHIFNYQNGGWKVNSESASKVIDQNWSGGDRTVNAYPFGLIIRDGRCHLTWCWRDTPAPKTSHDLCYAYSDDFGDTWKNNGGTVIAERGRRFITADSPGVSVWPMRPGRGFVNGGSMAVSGDGTVHVLARGENSKPCHFQRDAKTADWSRAEAPAMGCLLPSGKDRIDLVSDGCLYLGDTNTTVQIAPAALFQDGRSCYDEHRHAHDGWHSVIGQKGMRITVVDFRTSPDR